jgi:hypothetical protein
MTARVRPPSRPDDQQQADTLRVVVELAAEIRGDG